MSGILSTATTKNTAATTHAAAKTCTASTTHTAIEIGTAATAKQAAIQVTINHKHTDEVQTILQVFFPHTRVAMQNPESNTIDVREQNIDTSELSASAAVSTSMYSTAHFDYSIVSNIADGKVIAEVYACNVDSNTNSTDQATTHAINLIVPVNQLDSPCHTGSIRLLSHHTLDITGYPPFLTEKRLIMLALYHALQKSVPTFTPWGALTGVRPTKMVREWLEAGQSDKEIIQTLTEVFYVHSDRARLAVNVAHNENRLAAKILAPNSLRENRNDDVTFPVSAKMTQATTEKPFSKTTKGTSTQTAKPTPPKTPMPIDQEMPIALYISIPFCPSKCIYCSFNTANKPWDKAMQSQYVDALITEIATASQKIQHFRGTISSVYIGGGTPTALADHLLERLLATITMLVSKQSRPSPSQSTQAPVIEFTVEAGRPDTITRSNLQIMRNHNVNRISINPQTFNDHTLEQIGRKHTARDTFKAFALAREEGFSCINADIIAGLPAETPADMQHTMDSLAKLHPENITIHTLAIKRASKLNEQRAERHRATRAHRNSHQVPRQTSHQTTDLNINPPHIETIKAQLKIAHDACATLGHTPYYLYRQKNMAALFENTGFSLPGHECEYNIGMMSEVQTVIGIGAGAVSKYIKDSLITREFNPKNPEIYIQRQMSTN